MKKFLTGILAIIYLTVSTGFVINVHYCMGKIASTDLLHNNNKCDKCGMKSNTGGCCKDEFKVIKLSDSHKIISNDINISSPVAIIDNSKTTLDTEFKYSEINSDFNNHSPPDDSSTPLRLFICVFRI